jgi:hypothetical protein
MTSPSEQVPPSAAEPELEELAEISKEIAVELLAAGWKQREVAVHLNRATKTIQRWASDAEFRRRVRARHEELRTELRGKVLGLGETAIDVIEECFAHPLLVVRRDAAYKVINWGLKPSPQVDLESDLSDLDLRLKTLEGVIHE